MLCNETDVDCLRSRDFHDIILVDVVPEYIHRYPDGLRTWDFLPWMPVIDGTLLPGDPLVQMQSGQIHQVPVAMGTVRNETAGFVDFLQPFMGALEYEFFMAWIFNHVNDTQQVLDMYPALGSDSVASLRALSLDALFDCPSRAGAKAIVAASGNPMYVYHFLHVPSWSSGGSPQCTNDSVCHSAELPFVFRSAGFLNVSLTSAEDGLSTEMLDAWTTFAHTGAMPSPWPKFSPATPSVLLFDLPTSTTAADYNVENCAFWDSLGYIF